MHLERLGDKYICLGSYQEVTGSFFVVWEQSGLFSIPRQVSTHRAEGQARAKHFFMARGYCAVQPDSILHDQRPIPTSFPV